MELGCVGDEEDVAVNVDRRAYRPEEQGEDVARFMGKDKDWCAEIMHLKHTWIPKLLDIYFMLKLTVRVKQKKGVIQYNISQNATIQAK